MVRPRLIDQTEDVKRLCAALSGYLTGAPPADKHLVDMGLLDLARGRHRIAPILYKALSGSGALDEDSLLKDSPLSDRLHQLYQVNAARIMHIRSAEDELRAYLAGADIPFAIVKGLKLAEDLYEYPACRTSKDIDILVSPKHIQAALSALQKNGFIVQDDRSKKIAGKGLFGAQTYARLFKDITLIHPERGTQVELHQRLFHIEPDGFSEKVMEGAREANAPPISDPHYALYLILHGALVHWPRLKMVVDLILLIKSMPKQTALECLELAESYGAAAAFLASLDFAAELFPSAIPADWQSFMKDDKLQSDARSKLRALFRSSLMCSRQNAPAEPPVADGFWKLPQHIFHGRISNREVIWRRTAASIAVRF